jgi:SSS family solute:Na+ symporter
LDGLSSAVYIESLQFFLIVLGIAPLVYIVCIKAGGWEGILQHVENAKLHVWKGMSIPATSQIGVDTFSLVFGIGFVQSFGYWCTDFLVVQRAMD